MRDRYMLGFSLALPCDFSRVKLCADSAKVLWMRPPYVYLCEKDTHTDIKDLVVHVRVWWIVLD